MTQELACLLIGLGCWIICGIAWGCHVRYNKDTNAAGIAALFSFIGFVLIFIASVGYISSLPSIKEVGR